MKAIDYDIINHGVEHSQYFQGCGTYGTFFDYVLTGIGYNAKEAYEDAVEQAYMVIDDTKSLDAMLPKRPRGIRKSDRVPAYLLRDEESEFHYFVSIRIKTN